jgi:pilus assembly protein CpaB
MRSAAARRRGRGLVFGLISLVCGGLAAAAVHDKVERVESRTGEPVEVVVASADLPEGARMRRRGLRKLTVREVPARYAPRDVLADPAQALGLELAIPVARGSYLTAAMLRPVGGPAPSAPTVPRGQRLVEVAVSGGSELAAAGGSARVDVLVTKEGRAGGGRTFVALENVELVAARPLREAETTDAAGVPPDTLATLRVGARAAVFLTAAQNFARELRLLARPQGDRHRVGPATVGGGL